MANETTTKFKVDISELKKNFQEASRQIRLANSEFKAATSGMDKWGDSADGISAKLTQLNKILNAQKSQLSSLEKQYKLVSKEEGETSKGAQELLIRINNQKAAIGNTEKQIRTYNTKLQEMQSETNDADKVTDNLNDSLNDVKDSSDDASGAFTVMKGALANLVAEGISLAISAVKNLASDVLEVGKNFESSMSNVSALSGATGEDLEKLESTAREFGSTTQFSASEAADALGYMALAGWDANESCDALGGVLNLAAASGMELGAASDMVTDYLSAFSLEAKDSAYFADLLAYAQSNSNTTAEGLGEAFKNCAANMNAAGQDVETTTSLLAMMANQGLKGSEAGTALTAVMRDMTAKMKNGAIQIGNTSVSIMDANGNYRDMTDVLKDVENAVDGMGDAERATALQSTFTSDSIKGLNLMLNAGIDEASNFEDELRNCSGSAEEMASVMNNNLAGDLKAMNSAYEEFALTLYEDVNAPMRDIVKTITSNVLPAFTDMVKGVDGASEKIGEAIAGLISDVLKQITSMLPEFAEMGVSLIINLASGVLDSLPDIIDAVVEVIETVLKNLSKMLPQIVDKVIEIVPKVVDALINAVPELINGAIQLLMAIVDAVPKIIPNLVAAIPQIIESVVNGLIEAIPTLINGAIQLLMAIVDAIPQILPPLIEAIPTIVTTIVNGLIEALPVLLDGAIQLLMAIIDAIPIIVEALIPEIPHIITTIIDVLMENIPLILDAAIQMFMAIIEAIPEIIVALVEKLPEIVDTIFGGLIKPVQNLFGDLWNGIVDIWETVASWFNENVIQPLVKFFQNCWNKIKAIFEPVINWFKDTFGAAWNAIKEAFAKVGEFFSGIWNGIKAIFEPVINWFKDTFGAAWNAIKEAFAKVGEFFSGIWNGIKDAFSVVGTWFKDTFGAAWNSIKEVFEPVTKFFSGIWDGIKNAFGKVSDWFKDTFGAAWQKVKDVFSAGGKVFDGIKDGILNALKAVINALIRGINTVIAIPFDGINWALRTIKDIDILGIKPFDWINEIGVPQIPELAKGGVLKKGQVGLLEGNGTEAVVPLEKNTSWLDEIAKRLSKDIDLSNQSAPQTINNNTTNNFNQNNYSPKSLSRLEIYRQSKNLLSAKGV